MSTESLIDPTPEEAAEKIENSVNDGNMVSIYCNCVVEYRGRAKSYLPEGDRVVMRKPDGTMLIHSNEQHDPKNWQPPGATCSTEVTEGTLKVVSNRQSPSETIEVYCEDIYMVVSYDAEDTADIALTGTEDDMHRAIMENPEIIEDGFRSIENEKSLESGMVDVFGRDSEGTPVIIEVKRRRAQIENVDQLNRYVQEYRKNNKSVRGILVAPSASDKTKNRLKDKGLEFVSLQPREIEEKENTENEELSEF